MSKRSMLHLSLGLLVALGSVTAAAAQDIKYNAAPGTDFASFKTYKWQDAEKLASKDGLLDRTIMRLVDGELAKKGLVRTESEEADVYVVYQMNVNEDMTWSSYTAPRAVYTGSYDIMSFPGATTNASYRIRRGHLVVNVYDVKRKAMVWEAVVDKTLRDTTDIQTIEKNLTKVIQKIFKKYPSGRR